MFKKVVSGFAVLMVAIFSPTVVSSVDAKPFYKGKRIVFLGNYPAGGANSTEGRITGREKRISLTSFCTTENA